MNEVKSEITERDKKITEIISWITTTDKYKKYPANSEAHMCYYVPRLTFAELIYEYITTQNHIT